MRNWTHCSGVYSNMASMLLFLVCGLAAPAQQWFSQDQLAVVGGQPVRQPQQHPLDKAIQEAWQARNNGRYTEASAELEQARALLERVPVDAPQFAGWAQQVGQIYQNSGLNAKARATLQDALNRAGALGDWHPSRIALLNALGDSWRQDGNLLKAVGYLEQAATAQAAAPPIAPPYGPAPPGMRFTVVSGSRTSVFNYFGRYGSSALYANIRLAELYQQLGRPDAIAAIAVKVRTLGANDEGALAAFYEQRGQFDEAGASYRKLADQEADPQVKANDFQSLAGFYARHERYADAIAATRQAIAAIQSSDRSEIRDQSLWMRQNLAGYMLQAGQVDQADQTYRRMLLESHGGPQENQMLAMYSQYLANSQRAAQGEGLLKDYLAAHPNLDQPQKTNLLFQLANVVSCTGDPQRAEEYQQAAQALQPRPPPPPAGQIRIGEALEKARAALNQHRLEDAYNLTLQVIDGAAHAADGQQVQWFVPETAQALDANHEPAKSELLFRRLFALGQGWAPDNMQPLISMTQNYARYLMNRADRRGETAAAIEQYHDLLMTANGPDSGTLADPLQMRVESERFQAQWETAAASARELLALQESLSGNTSEAYLSALQNAAGVSEGRGDFSGALAMRRKAVTIADLLATSNNDWRRTQTRMDAALDLAHLGQFDAAETLGEEALAMQAAMRTPGHPLAQQLEQIRQRKQAASAAQASRAGK